MSWFKREPQMPGHAEAHNEAASLLELHLEHEVKGSDPLSFGDHVKLHNEIREEILRLRGKS